MSESKLDAAIQAYRENPTPENHAKLLALQAAHTNTFYASQTADYIRRTK